jgi:eukaryotic-like serine/threonine-protein kinase
VPGLDLEPSTLGALTKGPVAVGDVVAGKYRVEGFLGEGAMGLVVAARQITLDRLVAIKVLSARAGSDPVLTGRFMREARAAGKLTNEHVAKVIDVGTLPSGTPFMVMEHLEGADLGRILAERGPLDVATACRYVAQACQGIAEAHARGIVHRDLKPDNLYLTVGVGGESVVKVLDFGVSKVFSAVGQLTTTSSIVGSPVYMAPEQMRGSKAADTRSDVWSLGVVLYELMTGRCPFEADSLPELCMRVTSQPPSPIESYRKDLPPELVAVLSRCLEKEPARRFANAGELGTALVPFALAASGSKETGSRSGEAFASTAPGTLTFDLPRRRLRLAWALPVVGAALLAVLLLGRHARSPSVILAASGAGQASSAFVDVAPTATAAPVETVAHVVVAPPSPPPAVSLQRVGEGLRPARPAASHAPVDDIPAFR